jgi:hypothetical protein
MTIAAALLGASEKTSHALDYMTCAAYAEAAVAAATEAKNLGCGDPSHPQWDTRYELHFNWCDVVQRT